MTAQRKQRQQPTRAVKAWIEGTFGPCWPQLDEDLQIREFLRFIE